jgi:hypothetical protein
MVDQFRAARGRPRRAKRAEDDKLRRGIVAAARDFLTVGTPAEETAAARKQRAATYKVERIDLDDLEAAATTSHMQKITDYLGECDTRRERTNRVIKVGGLVGALDQLVSEIEYLRDTPVFTREEVEAGCKQLLERVADIQAYNGSLNLKPLHWMQRPWKSSW